MLNRSTFCLVLWLMSAPAAFSQTVTFTNLLLTPDGSADFGDEEFTDLPFSVGLLPETIPAGVRELVRVGPLTLTLALGQVEMRVELAAGGEAFTSRPVATGQLITATVGDGAIGHFASLAVGAGTTGLAITHVKENAFIVAPGDPLVVGENGLGAEFFQGEISDLVIRPLYP